MCVCVCVCVLLLLLLLFNLGSHRTNELVNVYFSDILITALLRFKYAIGCGWRLFS